MTLSTELQALALTVASRFDARIASASENSKKNLLDARAKCIRSDALTLMLASNFQLDAIDGANGAEHNVYALKCKLHNVVETLNARDVLNHYTRALFLTARNLHANNLQLTQTDADCVCDASFKAKKSDKRAENYVCTSELNKPSTNSTQKSSSLVTLCALNVLSRDGKSSFKFNADAHATKALEAALNLK